MWKRDILHQKDSGTVSGLDAGIKNSWKWSWLEKIVDGCPLSEFIYKHKDTGKALCGLCDGKVINYGGKGWLALKQHCQGSKHTQKKTMRKQNYKLPGHKHLDSITKKPKEPMIRSAVPASKKKILLSTDNSALPMDMNDINIVAENPAASSDHTYRYEYDCFTNYNEMENMQFQPRATESGIPPASPSSVCPNHQLPPS